MGDGGLASSVLNTYQPSENTITHSYAGKAKVKKKPGKMNTGKPNKGK